MERPARMLPLPLDLPAAAAGPGGGRGVAEDLAGLPRRARRGGPTGPGRDLRRWELFPGEKRGDEVGKTECGKGTKRMVLVDGAGVPLGVHVESAGPAEVKLLEATVARGAVPRGGPGRPRKNPERVICDRAYDSDPRRERPARRGIELVCPRRKNRTRPKTQDGRRLRRYKRRWKVERTFARLGNCRRPVVRWERRPEMDRAFLHVACLLITLRQF